MTNLLMVVEIFPKRMRLKGGCGINRVLTINRILFLVLDAPPHQAPDNLAKIKDAVNEAQKKGIRIIPVSASGIDWETEFFLRFLSVSTNSTYVFITDDSGIGNPHHVPTVGKYDVEYLNDLMVRLITKYGQDHD